MNKYQKAFEKVKEACASFDTVDELITLKELVDKATPKKPTECEIEDEEYEDFDHSYIVTYKGYKCSNCGNLLFIEIIHDKKPFCCNDCMQVTDWSEVQ